MEYHRIPHGSKWIHAENNTMVKVKEVGTCKLNMHVDRALILHDVLYAPEIWQNLVFVLVILRLGYSLNFHANGVNIYCGTIYVDCGFMLDGFMVLNINYGVPYSTINSSSFSLITSNDANIDVMMQTLIWIRPTYQAGRARISLGDSDNFQAWVPSIPNFGLLGRAIG